MIGKQLIYLGIYIMIICLIKNYMALIKYDLHFKKDIRNRGQIAIELLLKTMDMYVVGLDSEYCDPSTSYIEEKFCDLVLRWKFCSDETLPYGQNLSTDISSKCEITQKKKMPDNTRFFYYNIDNGQSLKNYSTLYPYVGYIYTYIVDGSFDWKNSYYETEILKIYTFFEPRINVPIVSRWKGITIGWKSIAMIEYIIKSNCQNNDDYGSTCWLTCVEDSRKTCNCNPNKRGSDYACTIKCKPGWVDLILKFLIKNYYVKHRVCFIKDHCLTPNYCKIENTTCLPYDNYTALCENLEIYTYSQMETNGIHSNVLYFGEIVIVALDAKLIYSKEIIPTISVTPDMENEAFYEGIFDHVKVLQYTEMEVSSADYLDKNYNLTFYINLDPWDRIYTRKRTFRINVSPGKLQLIHVDGFKLIDDVLYIGEQLYCNSSAAPEYRTILLWKADVLNISEPMMPYQTVDNTNPLFKGFVVCKVFMINLGRDTLVKSVNATVRIRPFVIFEWSNELDLIANVGNLTCLMKTYVDYTLRIIQMDGFTHVYTTSNSFSLIDLRGDQYIFVCMYNSSYGFFSTRYKRFVLTSVPTSVCAFLHPRTVGAIVQCDHDGFIPETYQLSITVSPINMATIPFNEGEKYLRIPYYLPTNIVIIRCLLREKYTGQVLMNNTFTEILSTVGQETYEFSPSNQKCTTITNYVEMPFIVKYLSNREIVLAHFIFYLEETTTSGNQYILVFYIHLFLFLCIIFWPYILKKFINKTELAVFRYGDRLNKWRVRRIINDKLNKISYDAVFIAVGRKMRNSLTAGDMTVWVREKKSSEHETSAL